MGASAMPRVGFGPVFAFEATATSRRWQVYAARAALVVVLLARLALIWNSSLRGRATLPVREAAAVATRFSQSLIWVGVALAPPAPPAAAAGAVCHDRSRGGLTHLLVTDLSDGEIILGKLAARLATVL